MRQRQSGIDLVRCVGLLFVVGVHAFLKNGYYSEPQEGIWMWLANSARWLFYCCNGLFMMLTGYLKSQSAFDMRYFRSLWAVLLGYVLTCVVSFPIRHFFLNEPYSITEWFGKMLYFDNYGWYVEMYIGLILISPLVNLALGRVNDRQMLYLVGCLVFLTALPSATSWKIAPDYWTSLYPLTYYMIGAVIRRKQPKLSFWLGALLVAAVAMGLGAVSLLSTDGTISDGFGQGYGGFWITLIATLVFLTLYRLQLGQGMSKVLAWAAGGVFEGYIMSRLLDVWVYQLVPQWHSPEKYLLIFLCVTLPVFIAAVLMGKAVHAPVDSIMRKSKKKISV